MVLILIRLPYCKYRAKSLEIIILALLALLLLVPAAVPAADTAAQVVEDLISAEAPHEGGCNDPFDFHIAPVGGKAGQYEDGLPLENRPDQHGGIPVVVDKRVDVHTFGYNLASRRQGMG